MCKHCLSKALTQLPRNTEDSAIAHLTPYLEFFFTVQSVLYRESSGEFSVKIWGNETFIIAAYKAIKISIFH